MWDLCTFCEIFDAQGEILNPTLTQDKQISSLYKLIFQSNSQIGSGLNFQLDHQWDDNILEIFSIFRKCT